MEEQPVALATIIRSPICWVSNLRYGVSPQPAHAPENSKSGWASCDPFTVSSDSVVRSCSGSPRKYSKLTRSASRWFSIGVMSIALCLTASLLLAGQMLTHTPQPVQSSGATWMIDLRAGPSRSVHSRCRKLGGASSSALGSTTLSRIAAWGQTSAQRAQSMQISGSQIGISAAMPRFSHCAVPVGNVPSTGRALTGSRSPSPAIIVAVTRRTKSGACVGTRAAGVWSVVGSDGTVIGASAARAASTAAWLRSSTVVPRLP